MATDDLSPSSTGGSEARPPTSSVVMLSERRVVASPSLRAQAPYALLAMRPRQWVKNGLVLLAIVFAGRLSSRLAVAHTAIAFFAFCLAASTIYLVNDIADRERDRQHPSKQSRPLASGRLTVRGAVLTAGCCAVAAGALTLWLALQLARQPADAFARWGGSAALFAATIVGYVILNLLYSAWLKHLVLWDVFCIAFGFVLRALAGAFAIPVPISPWFYLCTTFLALFLALGKRRAELVGRSDLATLSRANLEHYTLLLLDQLIAIVVTCTLITYSLYTFQGLGSNHSLMLTIPLVLFGVARYLYLIYVRHDGERPDEVLYRDPQILAVVGLWVTLVLALVYLLPAPHP